MTDTTSDAGTTAKERPAHKAAFATLDDAKKVAPPSDNFRIFLVTSPGGTQSYTWAQSADASITNAARADGYKAEAAEPKVAQVTKEKVAAKLQEFSDDELAAMGLSRKKGKKQ